MVTIRGRTVPAQMRILCRVVNGKGLAYVFAAPTGRYRAEQSKMLHVAGSIAFFAPRSAGKSSSGNSSGGGSSSDTMTAAQLKSVEKKPAFRQVAGTDRARLHAEHPPGLEGRKHDAPKMVGPTPNFFYAISSPQEDIGIMYGTPDFITFSEPNQMTMQLGMPDGQHGVMHYMHATEFNEFFPADNFKRCLQRRDNREVAGGREGRKANRGAVSEPVHADRGYIGIDDLQGNRSKKRAKRSRASC